MVGRLGFLLPLAVYLAYLRRAPFVRRHAAEALNFQLCLMVYMVSTVLLLAGVLNILEHTEVTQAASPSPHSAAHGI